MALSISKKIILILIISISTVVGIAIFSQYKVNDVYEKTNFSNINSIPAIRDLSAISSDFARLRIRLYRHVITTEISSQRDIENKINQAKQDIEKSFDHYTTTVVNEADKNMLAANIAAYNTYIEGIEEILNLSRNQNKTEALIELNKGIEQAEFLNQLLDNHLQFNIELSANSAKAAAQSKTEATNLSIAIAFVAIAVILIFVRSINNTIGRGFRELQVRINALADGDFSVKFEFDQNDEIGELANSIARLQAALVIVRQKAEDLDWLKTGVARVNNVVLGQDNTVSLASTVLSEIAEYIDAKIGAFFIAENAENGLVLNLLGTYAYTQRKNLSSQFRLGESLVGQSALEKKQILIQQVPDNYIRVSSGLGEIEPTNICVTPILFERNLRGVLEIGTLKPLTSLELSYLEQICIPVALALEIAQAQTLMKIQQEELRASTEELEEQSRILELSQKELQAQQLELESTNSELEAQMQRVKDSEDELKAQQIELEATNLELTDKNKLLERQKGDIEIARRNLEVQSEELALASKYKSEFLANMSHELRTPLNSLLLLARSLTENKHGNLNADQIETAGVIYDSGSDLLNLINEILDLSKIEAGRMDLRLQPVEIADLMRSISLQFEPMAKNQNLKLEIRCEEGLPKSIITDHQRLGQIIKNLMGNALKFTENGSVSISFCHTPVSIDLSKSGLQPSSALAIQVKDSGIGIPLDKQKIIFEAFQQADSGDRRRFGGTGLGLSISRELAALLGGEIQLVSNPGEGSTFSVYIPFVLSKPNVSADELQRPEINKSVTKIQFQSSESSHAKRLEQPSVSAESLDDRNSIGDKDRVVLIIEDDARFASILANQTRERGLKCLIALSGEEGLVLARKFRPDGIVLDILLPNIDGWDVLTDLKQNVDTRHIPVHIVSAEDANTNSLRIGAIGHACKPVRKEDIDSILERLEHASAHAEKWVLLVEDDEFMRKETKRVIGNGNVKVHEVGSGKDALTALHERKFALMILDLGLPDMQGLELLKIIAHEKISLPPVIVYTVRELTMDEEIALRNYADSIILKDVRSQERLIDEVALFLHRVVSELPEDKKRVIRHLHESDEHLKGRKILIVEDDMRTMFAMTKVLAGHGINPVKAENGQKALDVLQLNPDVDLILMDMMMPVMDGYEAMQRIRGIPAFTNLPIIALTAKAMKEDRKKCLEAGATDYLSKPVDMDRLLSLVRVWLCR
jgi:CheY-like chemotaxis protein/signal transduction histidine kinase/HAMP domain-containing protein